MSTTPTNPAPGGAVDQPVRDAATAEAARGMNPANLIVTVLVALTGWGVLSVAREDALIGLIGVLPGLVAAAGVAWAKARAVWDLFYAVQDKVTPTSMPAITGPDGRRIPLELPPEATITRGRARSSGVDARTETMRAAPPEQVRQEPPRK